MKSYDSPMQSFLREQPGGWSVPVLIVTLEDGSVWELIYGAKEWRELPPIPGSKRAQEREAERGT